MENTKLLSILETNEGKIAEELRTVEVADPRYANLMQHLNMTRGFAESLLHRGNPYEESNLTTLQMHTAEALASDSENVGEQSETAREEPVPKSEDETSEAVTDRAGAETAPEPEPEPKAKAKKTKTVKPAPKPEPTLTKQDMVTQLTYYSNEKGVNVADVMVSLGFSKLSDVAESQYQTLLDAVKEKAGEA